MPEQMKFLSREKWQEAMEAGEKDVGLLKFGQSQVKRGDLDPSTGMHDIETIISTNSLDRDRDIINTEGWELSHYKKNPVVLWAHSHREPPIARALSIDVKGDSLVAVDRFTPKEINPFGFMIYNMVREGFLNATSVGFKVIKYEINEERRGYDINEQELYEHSFVPVPANPEALVQAHCAGVDIAPLREWASKVLDNDPDGVHLWLPKFVVENVYKQSGFIIGVPQIVGADGMTDDVTRSGYAHVVDSDEGKDPVELPSVTTASWKLYDVVDDDNDDNDDELEDTMELSELIASIGELVSAVKEANDTNKKLVSLLQEKEEDSELSEEQIAGIAAKVFSDTIAEKTGALPD